MTVLRPPPIRTPAIECRGAGRDPRGRFDIREKGRDLHRPHAHSGWAPNLAFAFLVNLPRAEQPAPSAESRRRSRNG